MFETCVLIPRWRCSCFLLISRCCSSAVLSIKYSFYSPFCADRKDQRTRHARKNSRERSLLISAGSIRSNARLPLDTSSGSRGAAIIKRSLIDNACSNRSRVARVASSKHCQLQTYSLRANSAALVECVNKFPPTRWHEFSHKGP